MNKMDFLEYALGLCEKEIDEEIKSCSINGRFDRLIGLKQGLFIANMIAEKDWSENIMQDTIRNMIENY